MIDTSVIYQHPRGPPFKASLKWLAQKWLKKEIQTKTGEEGGHDSEEDARTAIELVKLKMDKGESCMPLLVPLLQMLTIPRAPRCAQALDSASLSTTKRRSLNASVAGKTPRPLRSSTTARRGNGTARKRLLPSRARTTMRCVIRRVVLLPVRSRQLTPSLARTDSTRAPRLCRIARPHNRALHGIVAHSRMSVAAASLMNPVNVTALNFLFHSRRVTILDWPGKTACGRGC